VDDSSQAASEVGAAGNRHGGRVVVGVDGSPGSRAALVWALRHAARRGADLEVVATFPVDLYWADPYVLDPARIDEVRADTRARAQAVVDDVRADPSVSGLPGVAEVGIEVSVAAGSAAEQLVQRGEDADLLVVGSRGRGVVRSIVLGSVALHCVTSARCPVVVGRPSTGASPAHPRVVVGLDGSDTSRLALVQAVAEADRLDAELVAVVAYEQPDYWSEVYSMITPSTEQLRAVAAAGAQEVVDDELAGRGADVRVLAVEGAPGDVLARQSEGAQLLVVGSRGRGELRGLLLGSVALHCVLHAPCPVMVVRSAEAGPDGW
jgi:nucleotide-binding universal stress UspA family protein